MGVNYYEHSKHQDVTCVSQISRYLKLKFEGLGQSLIPLPISHAKPGFSQACTCTEGRSVGPRFFTLSESYTIRGVFFTKATTHDVYRKRSAFTSRNFKTKDYRLETERQVLWAYQFIGTSAHHGFLGLLRAER